MGTATILGDTYQTKVIGLTEWMLTPLAYSGGGIPSPLPGITGRLYTYLETPALEASVSADGWRIPTALEWLAVTGESTLLAGIPKLKEPGTTHWDAPNTGALGYNDFSLLPFGFIDSGTPNDAGRVFQTTIATPAPYYLGSITVDELAAVAAYSFGFGEGGSLFFVRDVAIDHGFLGGSSYVDFVVAPERGYEPTITPSLEWTRLPSGLYRCLDDGAAYDAHDAEITVYVTVAVLSAWETFYKASKAETVTYYAPDGVLPFGPHIPVGSTGASVKITGWKNGGKVGITADLWKLTISMRLMQGYTPTLPAGVPALFGKKYATPSWDVASVVHLTDDGRASVTARSPEAQTCQVVADNFDAEAAASIINWALYTRGSSFTYSPPTGLYPFGPSLGNGPFAVRLIDWTAQKPNPRRWDFTFTLARE